MSYRARFVVDPAFEVGPVSPRLFGSFVEHLGRCVYRQSGLALGIAALGRLFPALRLHGYPRAFLTVEQLHRASGGTRLEGLAFPPRGRRHLIRAGQTAPGEPHAPPRD